MNGRGLNNIFMYTSFQKSVWEALKEIPRGRVTTYGEIAKFIGKPNATRAVGSAVGKNPNAPTIPCHRVVPINGKIGKYSGLDGKETKIKLLESEGVFVQNEKVLDFEERLYCFDEKGLKL